MNVHDSPYMQLLALCYLLPGHVASYRLPVDAYHYHDLSPVIEGRDFVKEQVV